MKMVEELSSFSIQQVLKTKFIGRNIIYYPELKSTMDAARESAVEAVPEGTVIITGQQIGGRGRMGRTWVSPAENIALSIILYPEIGYLRYLIMIASLATVYSVEAVTGLKAGIKWPNDVLIEGKKVCGILIENEMKGKKVTCSVVGIGINMALRPGEIENIAYPAAGLEEFSGRKISRVEVVGNLLNEFERWYRQLPEGKGILDTWRGKLVTLGRSVTATWKDGKVQGIAESVDESGALLLRLPDGMIQRVVAGDVTLRDK